MKYIKVYESFNIDDVMLEYVESNKCVKNGKGDFVLYRFGNIQLLNICKNRLDNFGIEYYSYNTAIYFVSDKLREFTESIFENLKATESEFFNNNGELIFRIDKSTPRGGILINTNLFNEVLLPYFYINSFTKDIYLRSYCVEKYISKYIPNYKDMFVSLLHIKKYQ